METLETNAMTTETAQARRGIKDLAQGRSDIFRLDPDDIHVKDGWNARNFSDPDNEDHVRSLADSIKAVGVLEPLTVTMEDGVPYLTNGESRLRAVRMLQAEGVEIKTVPVQTEARHASEADKLASQIVRNSGKPFSVLETAEVFRRLAAYGWSEKDIAARAGKSVERVRQVLSLNEAPAATRKLVQQGKVSATTVQRIIAKSGSAKEIDAAVKEAVSKAESEGRKKASPRHVEQASPKERKARADYKSLVEQVMSHVEKEPSVAGLYTTVELTIPNDLWQALQDAVK